MADEESTGLADVAAGAVGIVTGVLTMLVLSTLFSAGWAAVIGFAMGSALAWTTWWTVRHWKRQI